MISYCQLILLNCCQTSLEIFYFSTFRRENTSVRMIQKVSVGLYVCLSVCYFVFLCLSVHLYASLSLSVFFFFISVSYRKKKHVFSLYIWVLDPCD